MKLFKGFAVVGGDDKPLRRVEVTAPSIQEAMRVLEAEYGEGNIINLHNEIDANRPR